MIDDLNKKELKTGNGDNTNNDAINSPEEVEASNDNKIDQDFPGYPHYPANEDIMDPENKMEKVTADVEKLSRSNKLSQQEVNDATRGPVMEDDSESVENADNDESELSENDVTAEDLQMLGAKDRDMDMDEDEQLAKRGWTPSTGADLDVPGSEEETNDALEQGDEENSYYSLGGDNKDNLEENDDQNNF